MRLPRWRQTDYDRWGTGTGAFPGPVTAIFPSLVAPLVLVFLELPIALARSMFSSVRWVEAVCRWPSEIRITWRTSKAEADAVRDEIARRLEHGYEDLIPEGAERVYMTRPPGIDSLG